MFAFVGFVAQSAGLYFPCRRTVAKARGPPPCALPRLVAATRTGRSCAPHSATGAAWIGSPPPPHRPPAPRRWNLNLEGTSFADIAAAGSPFEQWDALPTSAKLQILGAIGVLEYLGEGGYGGQALANSGAAALLTRPLLSHTAAPRPPRAAFPL